MCEESKKGGKTNNNKNINDLIRLKKTFSKSKQLFSLEWMFVASSAIDCYDGEAICWLGREIYK